MTRSKHDLNFRNTNKERNGFITKRQIEAVFRFCRAEKSFEENDLQDAGFDDTDFKILNTINEVKKDYSTLAHIVDESFLKLNGLEQ